MNRPLNVLYLTMNPNRESTAIPTEGWFRLLPERGLRPVLVSRERGALDAWASAQGIATYQNPLPFPDKRRPLHFAKALWQLASIARRHQIQLIHCNEQDIYPIGQYLARVLRVPVVVSVHFTMERGFCQWAFGGRKNPDLIYLTSGGNLRACEAGLTGVIPKDRWRVLYNGHDLEKYRPQAEVRRKFREEHGLEGYDVIGVACALRPRKQLEHLFALGERFHSHKLKIVVAGGPVAGDEEYSKELLADGKQRLGDRLILLGHLQDLRGIYNGLDVYVNTSQEEACSLSIIEALASGCPVLGYPSKSVDDQILPGGGEIVEQDGVDALAQVLLQWLNDREQLAERRVRARRLAEERFDIKVRAEQLWEDYQTLVPQRNAKRDFELAAQ